jgi:hypothetical protein
MSLCDQCNSFTINGHFCHEKGCPNDGRRYDKESGRWIEQFTCPICGYERDIDAVCCDDEDFNEEEIECD